MENSYRLYQNYIQGVRCAYRISFPLLSFNKWLEKHGIIRSQFQEPKFQDSSFSRIDDNSSVSSAISATSLPSPDNSKKTQIDMLVSLWQENIGVLESTCSRKMWFKIKAAVDNLGPAKTIKQCKDKMRNIKDAYKRAKESNKKTGAAPSFPPYFTQIDEIYRCTHVMNLPEKAKVAANSISDDEINASSDSDSDVNKSSVLKQVP